MSSLPVGCQTKSDRTGTDQPFRTVDYVTVGKRLQRTPIPYVVDLANREKHLVFIGCNHIRDSTDKQFALIQQQFDRLKPQVAFNEGGQVSERVHYSSLQNAVATAGETGCLTYLSDQSKIRLLNGDTADSVEFSIMKKNFPVEELYVYYVMERIVIPYLSFHPQHKPFKNDFDAVVASFVRDQLPIPKQEQSVESFKKLYLAYTKRPFVLAVNQEIEKFDYVNGGDCHFCALGRRSKMVRDSILLTKLDRALDRYDRIIVTFGSGHALAVEPALRQLISKNRRPLTANEKQTLN